MSETGERRTYGDLAEYRVCDCGWKFPETAVFLLPDRGDEDTAPPRRVGVCFECPNCKTAYSQVNEIRACSKEEAADIMSVEPS